MGSLGGMPGTPFFCVNFFLKKVRSRIDNRNKISVYLFHY